MEQWMITVGNSSIVDDGGEVTYRYHGGAQGVLNKIAITYYDGIEISGGQIVPTSSEQTYTGSIPDTYEADIFPELIGKYKLINSKYHKITKIKTHPDNVSRAYYKIWAYPETPTIRESNSYYPGDSITISDTKGGETTETFTFSSSYPNRTELNRFLTAVDGKYFKLHPSYGNIYSIYPDDCGIVEIRYDINLTGIAQKVDSSHIFNNEDIFSLSGDFAVGVIGQELKIDTFTADVQTDSTTFLSVPYTTPIWLYGGQQASYQRGTYYVESIERIGKNRYRLNAMSWIGLLDDKKHKGGVYNGESFQSVFEDIVGDTIDLSKVEYYNSDVSSLPVYGWLPYGNARENLHKLLLAYNVIMVKQGTTSNFRMTLQFPGQNPSKQYISKASTRLSGSVNYGKKPTQIVVREHGFIRPISDFSSYVENTGSYGFLKTADGYLTSQNAGVNNSASCCYFRFNDHGQEQLRLEFINQGENNYDFGIIGNVDTALSTTSDVDASNLVYRSFKGQSSPTPVVLTFPLQGEGYHYVMIKFRKDSSQHTAPDCLKFRCLNGEAMTVDYGIEEVELFNNFDSGMPADHHLVVFSQAPVCGISADGLEIHERGPNCAVVSGIGRLVGYPYIHTTYDYTVDTGYSAKENVVSVTDNTLVSLQNSKNLSDRLLGYYGTAITSTLDYTSQYPYCGYLYDYYNVYNEHITNGTLETAHWKASNGNSLINGSFVNGITYAGKGNLINYQNILTSTSSSTWTVPSTWPANTPIRVVLIGGGSGGNSGYKGEAGKQASGQSGGEGGKGGAGGEGGEGGRIFIQNMTVNPGQSITYKCGTGGSGGSGSSASTTYSAPGNSGGNTTFGTYTSQNGSRNKTGYRSLFGSGVYGMKNIQDGIDGGDGGRGGDAIDGYNNRSKALGTAGGTIGSNTGGVAGTIGNYIYYNSSWYSSADYCYKIDSGITGYDRYIGTAGGGGASSGTNGGNAGNYSGTGYQSDVSQNTHWRTTTITTGNGGNGATPTAPTTATIYGQGGAGGHGSGGGGGTGGVDTSGSSCSNEVFKQTTSTILGTIGTPGSAGTAGSGGTGAQGCVIIYSPYSFS